MTGRSPQSLSRIPGFDPRHAPVDPVDDLLPPVGEDAFRPHALRQRFVAPPIWQPELAGDQFRIREGALRAAAVLVPLVLRESATTVLLTERTEHLSSHAGQIAFPGGRCDPEDPSPEHTALREAQEEIGLEARHVDLIGRLPDYLTGTGYRVTPVVGLVEPGFAIDPHDFEVAEVFEVPLSFLMDPRHHLRHRVRLEAEDRVFYSMPWRRAPADREYFIWGATAAMLRNLYRFLIA